MASFVIILKRVARIKISNYEQYSSTTIAVSSIYCTWKNCLGALSLLFKCKNELEHCYTE